MKRLFVKAVADLIFYEDERLFPHHLIGDLIVFDITLKEYYVLHNQPKPLKCFKFNYDLVSLMNNRAYKYIKNALDLSFQIEEYIYEFLINHISDDFFNMSKHDLMVKIGKIEHII